MKNNILYSLAFFMLMLRAEAQQIQLNTVQSGVSLFAGHVYAYGLSVQKQQLAFRVYKLDLQLHLKDSFTVMLPRRAPENYLRLSSDTLHNYLNIYLQEKGKEQVSIFRFSKTFEPVASIETIEIARLNNTSQFGPETMYSGNCVYSLKTQSDTSGKQFYLNKYTLRDDKKNFDYEFNWQFPFEKKGIRSAHIFFADKKQVLVYVHVSSGLKTGQWVLKLEAATGRLIRGTKVNSKGESDVYMFGNFIPDRASQGIQLLGEKFPESQFRETDNKLAIGNRPFVSLYLVDIDSSGDVTGRQQFKVPVTTTVSGAKKGTINYLLKIAACKKDPAGTISLETDVYSNTSAALCFLYSNTIQLKLMPNEDKMILEKNAVAANPLVEKFYVNADKLDMNGRLCIDSLSNFEKIFYKPLVLPVKQGFKAGNEGLPSWLLTRSNLKKETISYSVLQPANKNFELKPLDEILKTDNPVLLILSSTSMVISKQVNEGSYQLKLIAW